MGHFTDKDKIMGFSFQELQRYWIEQNEEDFKESEGKNWTNFLNNQINIREALFNRDNNDLQMATIGQNFENYEYSYQNGYYYAFRAIVKDAVRDVNSMFIPALYMARHYIELCLKDAIFNIRIIAGSEIEIREKQDHDLNKSLDSFLSELSEIQLDNVIDDKFKRIIKCINDISPKNYEFRYETSIQGKYNLPIDSGRINNFPGEYVNLNLLLIYIDYIHIYFDNLYFILQGDSSSVMNLMCMDSPYKTGIAKCLINSKKINTTEKLSIQNINCVIEEFYQSNNLPNDNFTITYDEVNKLYNILINDVEFFIIGSNEDKVFFKVNTKICNLWQK